MLKNRRKHSSNISSDDGTRRFLAVSFVIIVLLDLITYMVTRNTAVLNLMTAVNGVILLVFGYYFCMKK